MKTVMMMIAMLSASASFAQDMSQTEAYDQAYKSMPDGTSVYVGKCKTHEDQKNKYFKVVRKIQSTVYPSDYTQAQVKKIVDKVGMQAFRVMMKNFFSEVAGLSSDAKIMSEFAEYADDLTIEQIQLKDEADLELIRFNVGYGGGNGGYLVLAKIGGTYQTMSSTGDGSLEYCNKRVWKN